ncbi:MAG: acyl-CoA dehydrogenase family protein [Deltaproteobacteria bacterium]
MHFNFDEEQILFQESLRGMLARECTAERVRGLWDSETGRSTEVWGQLAAMGLNGLLVPEAHGGLGMDEVDLVLLLEEVGRVALAEPLLETATVAARLIDESGSAGLAEAWLGKIAAGQAVVAVGHDANPCIADAHVASLLLLCHQGQLHALLPDRVELTRQDSVDPGRRLFTVAWQPTAETLVAEGEQAEKLLSDAFDRGAFGVAAQLLGIAQQLIDQAVAYAKEREQFGRPIGSFQAVKHMLAGVQVSVEFARPVVYRAAFSVAHGLADKSLHASHAKAAASEAAHLAAKTALQVHGAIGYTYELDLHVWMKRAWSLEASWGTSLWHRRRLATAILGREAGTA